MKKIFLIISLIFYSSLFAESGDLDISLNFGLTSGTGLGLAYNLTDRTKIKFSGLVVGPKISNNDMMIIASSSLNFDFLNYSDTSSVYFLLSATSFKFNEKKSYIIISTGTGTKKFFGDYMFLEIEAGIALHKELNEKNLLLSMSGGINFGYRL